MTVKTFACSLCHRQITRPDYIQGEYMQVCAQCVEDRIYSQNSRMN